MKKHKNLAKMSEDISAELIDSIYLLRIMEELLQSNGQLCVLLKTIKGKTTSAFYKTEKYRKLISNV